MLGCCPTSCHGIQLTCHEGMPGRRQPARKIKKHNVAVALVHVREYGHKKHISQALESTRFTPHIALRQVSKGNNVTRLSNALYV